MILDWTVALLFRPDVTRVDLVPEREQLSSNGAPDIPPRRLALGGATVGAVRSPDTGGAAA
jgi:hypothetical protein